MDRGAQQATVHGVAKSRTRLSNFPSLHGKMSFVKHVYLNFHETTFCSLIKLLSTVKKKKIRIMCFGEEDHSVEGLFCQITSCIHSMLRLILITWLRQCFPGFFIVELLFSPFPLVLFGGKFWKEAQPTTKEQEVMLKMEYLHKLFGILFHLSFFYSHSFIYVTNYLHQKNSWAFILYFG